MRRFEWRTQWIGYRFRAARPPILGAFMLEGFRLAADPVNRRLISVPGLLKSASLFCHLLAPSI